MKVLIWIGCFFIASILNAILGYLTGWKVGYFLFYIGVYYVAKKIYKKWAKYKGIEAVPETAQVCARWHCEKCNSVNFSYGFLSCNVKHKFNMILSDPSSHPGDLRKKLSISDPYCQKCRRKAIWTYGRWSFWLTVIACVVTALLSVIGILDTPAEIVFWIALASSVVIAIPTLIIDSKINTRIHNLPEQYVPVIWIEPKKDQSYKSDNITPTQPNPLKTQYNNPVKDNNNSPTVQNSLCASDNPCENCHNECDTESDAPDEPEKTFEANDKTVDELRKEIDELNEKIKSYEDALHYDPPPSKKRALIAGVLAAILIFSIISGVLLYINITADSQNDGGVLKGDTEETVAQESSKQESSKADAIQEDTKTEMIVQGVCELDEYHNDYFGIGFELYRRFKFKTEEEILELNGLTEKMFSEQFPKYFELGEQSIYVDMFASDNAGNNVIVSISKRTDTLQKETGKDFYSYLEKQTVAFLSDAGCSDINTSVERMEFLGEHIYNLYITYNLYGIDLFERQISIVKGDYELSITVTCANNDATRNKASKDSYANVRNMQTIII